MDKNYEESDNLIRRFEEREAGVTDLMKLYDQIEDIYSKAASASYQIPYVTTSNSTNRG